MGQGVVARVEGHRVALGNVKMMKDSSVPLEGLEAEAERFQSEAKTVVWVAVDGEAVGLIGIADTPETGLKGGGSSDASTGLNGGHDDRRQRRHGLQDC